MDERFIDELKQVVRGEVLNDEVARDAVSEDASIFKVRPELVVVPEDKEDIKNLVKLVRVKVEGGQQLSLTARSGGTDMTGGPLSDSIVVSMKKLNKIKEIGRDYAIVEPGTFYRDLEKQIKARGLMIPSYPASKDICTVGGMVANNSGGEKTLAYGKTELYVAELKVVLGDGEEYTIKPLSKRELDLKMAEDDFEGHLYRRLFTLIDQNRSIIEAARPNVSKNSSGYYLWNVYDGTTFDLPKLFVGSQGTLGFVTEIKFRLIPIRKYTRLTVAFLKDLAPLAALAQEVLKFKPESFESYDNHTLEIAMRFLPDLVKKLKSNIFMLGIRFLPEFLMVLRGGLPKLVLLIELTSDDKRELDMRTEELMKVLSRFRVRARAIKSEKEAEKYWTVRRESFNLLRQKVKNRQTAPFVDDVVVRPEYLSRFLPELNAILEPYGGKLIYTIAGHVGDGNFHIIPLMDLRNPETKKIIEEISAKVYPLVLKYHGSITAEHNDGLIRTPYVQAMYGDQIYALFVEVKRIFDPLNIFNPRKKVGGDLKYALAHIK